VKQKNYGTNKKSGVSLALRRAGVAIAAVFFALSALVLQFTTAGASPAPGNPNNPAYWEALYELPAGSCVKYDPPNTENADGYLDDDGKAVVLNPGTWALLVVKGGSVDIGSGAGNAVYELPIAGELYYSPKNGGGNVPEVSHWIICAGLIPPPTTTTSTVPPTTSTTSTVPPTTSTTSTVPPTTSTTSTVPPTTSTTSTVPPTTSTTSTVPPTTSSTTTVPAQVLGISQTAPGSGSSSSGSGSTSSGSALALTGSNLIRLLIIAALLVGSGATALQLRRRYS